MAIILDASWSPFYSYELSQDLATLLVQGLNFNFGRIQVAVVTFQDTADVRFQLNTYTLQDEVVTAIAFDQDIWRSGTNTADAFSILTDQIFTSANGDRNGIDNIAIVLSDGKSNVDSDLTISKAEAARNSGIRVVSVGMGSNVNPGELEGMASEPASQNVFYLPDENQLEDVANQILDAICP